MKESGCNLIQQPPTHGSAISSDVFLSSKPAIWPDFFCKHVSRHRGMKVRYNKHVTNSRHNDMVAFGPVFDALFRKLHVENVWVPFFVNLSHL